MGSERKLNNGIILSKKQNEIANKDKTKSKNVTLNKKKPEPTEILKKRSKNEKF